MKVTLISPYINIAALGLRFLSSYLRGEGHRTQIIFLSDLDSMIETGADFHGTYSERVLDQLVEACSDSDLIGFTLMTNYFYKVADLSRRLGERLSVPIVWGGSHPTAAPEECLEYADLVCVGEGERSLLDVLQRLGEGRGLEGVPNMWVKGSDPPSPSSYYPPVQNLDALPFPDYCLEDHFILLGDRMVRMREDILRSFSTSAGYFESGHETIYQTIASRGCPYNCAFCINSRYLELYGARKFFRRRSMENVVAELESVLERFEWFNGLVLHDDCFTAASPEELREFERLYTERVGLPLFVLLSSTTMDREHMGPLIRAGLQKIQVGVQSASDATNTLYDRGYFSPEKLLRRASELQDYSDHNSLIIYDIMLDSPFEDVDSMLQTLRLVIDLPRPKQLQLYSLTLYPGTRLRDLALERGMIEDPRAHYLKENHERRLRYINLLFTLVNQGVPDPVIRLLSWRPWVHFMESPPVRWVFSLLSPLYNRMLRSLSRRVFAASYSRILELTDGSERPSGATKAT
jgi:radical SAM superfamily enzyme YgiQ (UPF0313 family)